MMTLSPYNKVFNAQKSKECTVFCLSWLELLAVQLQLRNAANICVALIFFIISRSLIYRRLHANLQAYGIIDFPLRYENLSQQSNDIRLHEYLNWCGFLVKLYSGAVRYASVWLCFWLNSRNLSFRWNSVARDKIIAVACQCRSPFSEYQMCINVWLLSSAALLSWMEIQDFVNVF